MTQSKSYKLNQREKRKQFLCKNNLMYFIKSALCGLVQNDISGQSFRTVKQNKLCGSTYFVVGMLDLVAQSSLIQVCACEHWYQIKLRTLLLSNRTLLKKSTTIRLLVAQTETDQKHVAPCKVTAEVRLNYCGGVLTCSFV